MSNKSKKAVIGVVLGSLIAGMSFQSTALAAASDRGKKAVTASVSCGGNYFVGNGGIEIQRSTYIMRNVSDVGSIYIDRVRVFNAKGVSLFDSDVSGIPASRNNTITPVDNSIEPRQTANLRIQDLIPMQGRLNRPLQTVIDWSADEPVLTLDVGNVRTTAAYDSATATIGAQSGRHSSACRTTARNKHY